MPTYEFRNKETGEVTEVFMKMSAKEQYLIDNPHLEQTMTQAPGVCDPTRIGVAKKDTGFKEVLQKIHSRAVGSVLNKTSSQL